MRVFVIVLAIFMMLPSINVDAKNRVGDLVKNYNLIAHEEGGYFAEVYTSSFESDGRATAGSIFFLLNKNDISHFHEIDCDEIWYYHEGCGLKITLLQGGKVQEIFLGNNIKNNEHPIAIIPAKTIMAAENLNKKGYTLISCMTTPKFKYSGFRLVKKDEVFKISGEEKILYLAYE